MKKLILLLFCAFGMSAQNQVFNVQQYCVDQSPFKKGQCDISGNEYSFVFLNTKKKELVFFFTDIKLKYNIVAVSVSSSNPKVSSYTLQNKQGLVTMNLNQAKTKIEFLYPDKHIYLTVGNSTKR